MLRLLIDLFPPLVPELAPAAERPFTDDERAVKSFPHLFALYPSDRNIFSEVFLSGGPLLISFSFYDRDFSRSVIGMTGRLGDISEVSRKIWSAKKDRMDCERERGWGGGFRSGEPTSPIRGCLAVAEPPVG